MHNPSGRCGQPVWIWVHGGGYQTGDKANQMADKVRLASAQGWLLVSVNYRLTDPADPNSARFPDHYDDVAAAVAWVSQRIGPLGGDPDRIALFGHSAGADIVANVVVNPTYLNAWGSSPAVVDCAGPLDTEGFDKVAAVAADPDGERAIWEAALGNHPGWPTDTSARLLVRPDEPLPAMIGAVRGTASRQAIATSFLDTVRATGVTAVAIDARSLSHSDVNSRLGALGDAVMTPPVVAFLSACFGGA